MALGATGRKLIRRSLALPFLFLAMAAASACGPGDIDPDGAGPLAVYQGRNHDDADWHGILVREGKCLYVDWENPSDDDTVPDSRMLVAFPKSGTRWNGDTQTVRFDGDDLVVGQWVDIGGGGLGTPVDEFHWFVPPDPSCDVTNVFLVG